MIKQMPTTRSFLLPHKHNIIDQSSVQVQPPQVQCRAEPSLSLTGMRMLSDSLVGVDEGSSSATAAPLLVALAPPSSASTATTARWAWTASQAQAQLTPDGRISTTATTGFVDVHRGLILAALLCGLVGAVSLHSLLRCALHYCVRRRRRAQLAGLKESALRRMPVVLYEAEAAGAECAICLGEFEDGDAVRLLPRCRHGFHVRCIDTWLSTHSSCPICRDSLLDEGGGAAAGEETVAGAGTQRHAVARAAWMSPEFAAAMLLLA